jgi:hypothetical protein
VDEVELAGALEELADVQRAVHVGVETAIFFESDRDDSGDLDRCARVAGGEERDVQAARAHPRGDVVRNLFPRAVARRRRRPRYRSQNRKAQPA